MSLIPAPLRGLAGAMAQFTELLQGSERRRLLGILASNVVVAALDVVSVIGVYRIVDSLVSADGPASPSPLSAWTVTLPVSALILRAAVGSWVAFLYAQWVSALLKRLLDRLFLSYLSRPFNSLAERSEGVAVRDFQQVRFITDGFSDPAFALSRELTSLVAVVSAVFVLDAAYATVLFGVLGVVVIAVSRSLGQWLGRLGALRNESQAAINDTVSEALRGGRETRLYRAERFWQERFDRPATDLAQSSASFNFGLALPRYVFELAAIVAVAFAAVVSLLLGETSAQIVPVIAGVGVAAVRTAPSAAVISASLQALAFYRPQVDSAMRDIALIFDAARPEERRRFPPFGSSAEPGALGCEPAVAEPPFLAAEGVQIRRGEKLVPARPVSFEWDDNGLIALVGESGSGKSSLIDAILGVVDIATGVISHRGFEVRGLISEAMPVGVVPQRPFVVSGTVRDNLCFGLDGDVLPSDREQQAALVAVGLDQRLGLDAPVSADAKSLSGGQAYRLAIARSVIRSAKLLLLDEPTGALDDETAESIIDLLGAESQRRLIVVATHDQRLVRRATSTVELS